MTVLIMPILSDDSPVVQQTRSLCQTILEQPEYRSIRQRILDFQSDDSAVALYRSLADKQSQLQQKQQEGKELTDAEIDDFERDRQQFFNNPVASDFMEAQQEMHEVKKAVTQILTRAMELGRVPDPEELRSGPCGQGCNCH
jgi:cell fate (sporulation/competence/biofilm development) regulator YlbF (YheA/YmcA/DUF963 family)